MWIDCDIQRPPASAIYPCEYQEAIVYALYVPCDDTYYYILAPNKDMIDTVEKMVLHGDIIEPTKWLNIFGRD